MREATCCAAAQLQPAWRAQQAAIQTRRTTPLRTALHCTTRCCSCPSQVRQYAPDDLLFVIEDITSGDDGKVGVMW